MSQVLSRNNMLDSLRFLAIIGVLILHYPISESFFSENLRLLFRWCVPYFFMLTGCFLLSNSNGLVKIEQSRLSKITVITLFANLFFLPLSIFLNGLSALDEKIFTQGSWFHLWFLNAMLFAFVVLQAVPNIIKKPWAIDIVAIIIFMGYIVVYYISLIYDQYHQVIFFFRQLSAVSFIWFGFRLKDCINIGVLKPLIIIIFGVIATIIEAAVWKSLDISTFNFQLPIGATIIAIGLLIFGLNYTNAPSQIAYLGRNLVLPIYIFHPIFLKLFDVFFSKIGIVEPLKYMVVIFFSMVGCTVALVFFMKVFPILNKILKGKIV